MATKLLQCKRTILYLFLALIICNIPKFSGQSNEQNIQTFYPLPIVPTPPATTPPEAEPALPPPATTAVPPAPGKSSSRNAVAKAIGITAASAIALSGLIFFLLLKRSRKKRARSTTNPYTNPYANPAVPQNDQFVRLNGNIRGVVVDENGLDVLYWRKLEGEGKQSFKKQVMVRNSRKEEKEEEKRTISSTEYKKSDLNVQERPLLRGKSSTSQSPVWLEKEDLVTKKETISSSIHQPDKHSAPSSSIHQPDKHSAPPPPRPPPPPPQLRPPVFLQAIPDSKTATSPPPPPTLPPPPGAPNRGPAPPPPPPPKPGGVTSSLRPPSGSKNQSLVGEGTSSKGNGQVKLKPLHWDKMNPDVKHSMVWDKIDKGSFSFDGDLMEALFGYVASNRRSPQRERNSFSPTGDKSGPPSKIFILDTRKSQNTAIVLKSLSITRKEIIDALIEGHGLSLETLEKLTRIAPTSEEESEILAFDGDPSRLADAESFLYHLLKTVPSAFTRFNALLFRSNYDSEVSSLKESLQSLELACKELRTRGMFLKLLEAVLKAGNRLNAGTSRGNAQAFNLNALRKLADVKSTDGKTTLLQFVVQEVVRAEGKRCVLNRNRSLNRMNSQSNDMENKDLENSVSEDEREKEYMMLGLPIVGGLSAEFANVKKAASIDYDTLVKTCSHLTAQVLEIRKMVSQCGNDGGFAKELESFLGSAEVETEMLKSEQERIMELVKKTTDYYQAGSSKDKGSNQLQLFVIVRDFLRMVDQVCIDIARNLQKKKPASAFAGSSSTTTPGSPRVFRFPKLPANFLSDQSKTSSNGPV